MIWSQGHRNRGPGDRLQSSGRRPDLDRTRDPGSKRKAQKQKQTTSRQARRGKE